MRIGLDVRYISHGLTGGVRTYVYHLARELPAASPADEFYYYADSKAPLELSALPANVTLRTLPWRSTFSSILNDRRMSRWMARDAVDVAHYPGNYGPVGPHALVVTVHDALNLFPMREHLRGFSKHPRKVAMMMYLGSRTRRALREADALITVSEDARRAIVTRSGCQAGRIVAVHEAASDEFRVAHDDAVLGDARRRFDLAGLVVLADGLKNPQAVVDAFQALPGELRATATLAFFSREAAPRPPVAAALGLPGVRFISRPTTSDLVLLMNLASVFVFPSWYEGFGLPLVEAMSCGLPVIASSRASIPEVLGGAGLLFDLEDPAALANHLCAVLASEATRASLRAKSLERAASFSWRQAAERTLEVYRRALAGSGRRA
jgi:glycosyltransferase involved in cell wall biosynthesis